MGGITDPIANYLTQIRNASRALKENVTIARGSKITVQITEILKQEGFIKNFKVIQDGPKKSIRIHLKYLKGKKPAMESLIRISKPGLRRYVACEEIPKVIGGLGISILSTSNGILSDRKARKQKMGGELLCTVW
jgi:small subunit ribosomal protein S8